MGKGTHQANIATNTHVGRNVPDHIAFPLILQRLKSRVKIDANGCWLYTGVLMPTGYADVCFRGKNSRAHRVMYTIVKGPIGKLHVMHSCDVRHCINPDHLSLGTNEQNIHDAIRKGRPHRANLMSAKTHCPQGHPYDLANVRWDKGRRQARRRVCTTCGRMSCRKRSGWPAHLLDLPAQPRGKKPAELLAWRNSQSQRGTES